MIQDVFVHDGSSTPVLALSRTPIGAILLMVQTAGFAKVPTDDYALSGTDLTLTYSPGSGEKTVVSYLSLPL